MNGRTETDREIDKEIDTSLKKYIVKNRYIDK